MKSETDILAMLARPCYGLCMAKKKMTPAQKAAQMLSKLGASKGGKARAETLTPEQRKAIAQKAAKARWGKPKKTGV